LTKDAILATIVDGGQAILLKTQRLIEKKYFSFILSVTTVFFWLQPQPTPWTGHLHVELCRYIKSMPLEGQTAPPPWSGYLLHFLWVVVDGLVTSRAHRM
jgi:hypothetical protein